MEHNICAPYFRVYLLARENRENKGRTKIFGFTVDMERRTATEVEKVGREFQFLLLLLTLQNKPVLLVLPQKFKIPFINTRLPEFHQNFTFLQVDQYSSFSEFC